MVINKRRFVLPLTAFCVAAGSIAHASDDGTSVTKTAGPKYSGHRGAICDSMGPIGRLIFHIPHSRRWSSEKRRNGATHPSSKSHAKLQVRGLADLGNAGTLEVRFRGGYVPVLGEEREMITSKELRGKFALLVLPELPAAMMWDIAYDDLAAGIDRDGDGRADVTLLVVQRGDEPATPALTPLQRLLLESHIVSNTRLLDGLRKNVPDADKIEILAEIAEQKAKDAEAETDLRRQTQLRSAARLAREAVARASKKQQDHLYRIDELEQPLIRYKQMLKREGF